MKIRALVLAASGLFSSFAGFIQQQGNPPAPQVIHVVAVDPTASKEYIAALDVARVFGRTNGCAEADSKLITLVAQEALKAGVDPRVLAATIAVESGCNQFATSTRGAIGLTQIRPTVWKGQFDFEHTYNLLNEQDNIHVGAAILGGLIKQFGTVNGLRRYNGLGVDCETCDAGYPDKITTLAARR